MTADTSRHTASRQGPGAVRSVPDRPLIFGTRGSALALWQTNWVIDRLREQIPGITIHIETIRTQGDRTQLLNVPLTQFADKSIFVAELEQALLVAVPHGEMQAKGAHHEDAATAPTIDAAVHSLKDLASTLPDELILAAVTERADPRDALVSRHGYQLETLPRGAIVATGSLRRCAQLRHVRSDLRIVSLRGNVDTRVRKALDPEGPDAVVLAAAGLHRLGLEHVVSQYLPVDVMVPAVGQGALTVEIRRADRRLRRLLAVVDHTPSHQAARAERAVLAALGGGCRVPLGAYAEVSPDGATLDLMAVVATPDGTRLVRSVLRGPASQPARLGRQVAAALRRQGGAEIVRAAEREANALAEQSVIAGEGGTN